MEILHQENLVFSISQNSDGYSAERLTKWVAFDGSQDFFPKEHLTQVMLQASAAAILNHPAWNGKLRSPDIKVFRDLPFTIPRVQYHGRFPQLVRDILEYRTVYNTCINLEPDVAFIDGSILGGPNWFARRSEKLSESGSIAIDLSLFQDQIDNKLIPAYSSILGLGKEMPIVFLPKGSTGKALLKYYIPDLFANSETNQVENNRDLEQKRASLHNQLSDVLVLWGKLDMGEYILPNIPLTKMISGGGSGRFDKEIRENLTEARFIIFQAGDPRLVPPIRIELNKRWVDDKRSLHSILRLITKLYVDEDQNIWPISMADDLAKSVFRDDYIAEYIEHQLFLKLQEILSPDLYAKLPRFFRNRRDQ